MGGPLDGLVVLDLTRLQPGNYATLLLADMGAEVIKVEEPGRGDYIRWTPPMLGGSSAMHEVVNRGKKSITLNLKSERGPELLGRLAADADVLIESFRPGVLDRLGTGYSELSQINPALVYVAITGYGQDGPYKDRAGHDINYLAYSAVLGSGGERDGAPALPSVQIADLSGAMMAVIGALGGLHQRAATGKGSMVDVGMMDVAISWLALHLAPWFAGESPLRRGAGYLNGGFAFYRVYRCADDKYLSVGAIEPQFWSALCSTLDRQDLLSEQFSPGTHEVLEGIFLTKTRDEWVSMFEQTEACVAPVNDFEEMAADPQVIARKMITGAPRPDAPGWKSLGAPVKIPGMTTEDSLPAPGLGEHNGQIYERIGISADDLDALGAQGAI